MLREVVIVSGVRTAIGDYMGSLSNMTPVQLGVTVLKAAIARAGIEKNLVQEVVAGQCNQAGSPGNTASHRPRCGTAGGVFCVHGASAMLLFHACF